jgi:two-component system chemotaxis response regulator CheB
VTPPRADVRVVVVEDSLVQRAHLVRVLTAEHDGIVVVGEATGASEAVKVVEETRPDVVTLDLEIPDGGGGYAIEKIMAHIPTPILVLSASVTGPDSAAAVDALMAGAVDALPKPARWTAADEARIRKAVRSLRGVTVLRHHRGRSTGPRPRRAGETVPRGPDTTEADAVVAVAASTGGPPALAEVLSGLRSVRAPVLVVQHLHPDFVDGLVSWMSRASGLAVEVARHGERLNRSTVYVAPGNVHLRLGPDYRIVLAAEPVKLHRPSADELFRSVAQHAGPKGIGVLLTGMGDDGADGLLALRRAGGATIAQDEETSAVFGMPNAARRAGAVESMLPLGQVAAAVLSAERRTRP